MSSRQLLLRVGASLLLPLLLVACQGPTPRPAAVPEGSTASLTLLETTDLHSNVLSFDYYRLQADPSLGLERTATLVARAREEFPNTLLFDAGDTIQGTVLADYQALVTPPPCDEELAIYRAMDHLGYDGGTTGNHEYNYGLPWLARVTGRDLPVAGVPDPGCRGPGWPIVLANVFSAADGTPLFPPWTVIERRVRAVAPDGTAFEAPLRVGLIGFTPPRIMDWDRQNLEGRVTVSGVVEAARRYLPELAAAHPDLVVAIIHGGPSSAPYTPELDNAVNWLAQVPGLDAIMMGHSHQLFPGPRYADMAGVDNARGTIHGVPAVMASMFGKALGLVHLELAWRDGRWRSDAARARSETWPICPERDRCVEPDPEVARLVAEAHAGAITYVETPIGSSARRLTSYFADLGGDSALAAVHGAQRAWALDLIAREHPELASLPVISAAAAFRTGFAGPDDYTDVAAGTLSIRSAADLYFYPNTITAVRVDGALLKAWLEHAALRFNRIDPADPAEQPLVNTRFPGYNFDQLAAPGLSYVIDVSRPAGERILDLRLDGAPVATEQEFIVVTNNYRASGGGQFPGLDGSRTVLAPTIGNREIVIDWIRAEGRLDAGNLPASAWRFAPTATRGPVTVTSASGKAALAAEEGIAGLRLLREREDGTSVYALDLAAGSGR